MAQVFGKKSEYLIGKDRKHRKGAVIGLIFLFIIIFIIAKLLLNSVAIPIGVSLFILFIILALDKIIGFNINTSGKYSRGRTGEYEICEELSQLPEEFIIFQDVKIQKERGNIDFVIVGSTGIFAIEVKSHKGKVSFDGENLLRDGKRFEKNILNQALAHALNLREYLKQASEKEFFINPVLVFSNPYASMRFGMKPVYKNVYVVQKSFLNQLIVKNGSNLSQADIEMIRNELIMIVKN